MSNQNIADAIALIGAQQAKVKPRSPQWMVGEQLKYICRQEPRSTELIAQDLHVEAMSITESEKKIKAFADKNKTGSFSCVTPVESDRILREFYGLPKPVDVPQPMPEPVPAPPSSVGVGEARSQGSGGAAQAMKPANGILDLMDFL